MNVDQIVAVEPLNLDCNGYMCAINLLLIHAMRHGYVEGTTIDDVLSKAHIHIEGQIIWKYPDRPVLCPSLTPRNRLVNVEKPASTEYALSTIRSMATAAGLDASIINTKAIRNGSARDLAYVKTSQAGVAVGVTALALGHSVRTRDKGVTQDYIGPLQDSTWSDRASARFNDKMAPKWHENSIPAGPHYLKRSKADTDHILQATGKDIGDRKERNRTQAANISRTGINAAGVSFDVRTKVPTPKSYHPIGTNERSVEEAHQDQIPEDRSHLDPELFEMEKEDDMSLDDDTVKTIYETILGFGNAKGDEVIQCTANGLGVDDATDDMEEEMLRDLSSLEANSADGDLPDDIEPSVEHGSTSTKAPPMPPKQPLALRGNDFIDFFTKINLVKVYRGRKGRTPEEQLKDIARGNSRDDPTPFLFSCNRDDCLYSTPIYGEYAVHTVSCKSPEPSASNPSGLGCNIEGCGKIYATKQGLSQHMAQKHAAWVPIGCLPCGIPRFETRKEMDTHQRVVHRTYKSPVPCPLQSECHSTVLFNAAHTLARHLKKIHRLPVEEQDELVPRGQDLMLAPASGRQRFEPKRCVVQDCARKGKFTGPGSLRTHLMTVHSFTDDQVELHIPGITHRLQSLEANKGIRAQASKIAWGDQSDCSLNEASGPPKRGTKRPCPFEDCNHQTIREEYMVNHLRQRTNGKNSSFGHGLQKKEAETMARSIFQQS